MSARRIVRYLRSRAATLWIAIRNIVAPEPQHQLYLVKSTLIADGWTQGPSGHRLYYSSFNPAWFAELDVQPAVIFDVGSFDGGDALSFKTSFPEAHVFAIEADPQRAKFVREALDGTGIGFLECAVIDRDRPVSFYSTTISGERSSQGSVFKFNSRTAKRLDYIEQSQQSVTVSGRSLASIFDELAIDEVSLLHMDIQGAEYEALQGLKHFRPKLVHLEVGREYKGARGPSKVHALITGMGYDLAADFINDRLYVLRS